MKPGIQSKLLGNILDIRLLIDSTFTFTYKSDLLGGIVLVEGAGFLLDVSGWEEKTEIQG